MAMNRNQFQASPCLRAPVLLSSTNRSKKCGEDALGSERVWPDGFQLPRVRAKMDGHSIMWHSRTKRYSRPGSCRSSSHPSRPGTILADHKVTSDQPGQFSALPLRLPRRQRPDRISLT